MSKEASRARYTLPDVVNPTTSVCFAVNVPNDVYHIAAFKGQIMALARAYSWANDTAHTAKDVAAVWSDIFDNLEACEMVNIRLKPTDFCTLQLTLDGGLTWTDVADFSACAAAAAVDEIGAAIDRGDLSGGGQQPGQGTGVPSQCYDYDITLHASDRWLAPIALEASDTIEISQEHGAWWDGNILFGWNCPDGQPFVLGTCAPSGSRTESTDPIPTLSHMRIIGNLPADTTTPYFDLYNTLYTVPFGVPQGDLYVQANDSVLPDNQGSINLHVQICKGGWTSFLDFQLNDYGFLPSTDVAVQSPVPTWVAGQGWQDALQSGFTRWGFIYLDIDSTEITRIGMSQFFQGNSTQNGAASQIAYVGVLSDGTGQTDTANYSGVHDVIYLPSPAVTTTRIGLVMSEQPNSGQVGWIRSCLIYGRGTKPSQLP